MSNRARPADFFRRTVVQLSLFLVVFSLTVIVASAQSPNPFTSNSALTSTSSPSSSVITDKAGETLKASDSQFRIERRTLAHGAELLTLFGRLDGLRSPDLRAPEIPLVSVVRDTLGDDTVENDRLRYVWMLTYTRPTLAKRIASAVPFLYQRVGNRTNPSRTPAPIIDLANPRRAAWKNFFWIGLQHAFFDTYGLPLKASSRTYRRNILNYRTAHLDQALAILGSYQNLAGRSREENEFLAKSENPSTIAAEYLSDTRTPLHDNRASFTANELQELRARLLLSQQTFASFYGAGKFHSTITRHDANSLDSSGHNWELLRQQAEAGGFYFEPLTMPDGTATHALLWISRDDLRKGGPQPYAVRFLNIANPWTDKRLQNWKGFSQTWFFDENNRRTNSLTPGGRSVEMIPVALYGLNHPKIPVLLVDLRDSLNPKKREMSRQVFNDVTRNILSLSSFSSLPYFAGRKLYSFITGRRGMDLNQPSRVRSYAELKLVLAFNSTIDSMLREELEQRLETVSLNPFSNDTDSEIALARKQYDALIKLAEDEDGLPAKIERDRAAEMTPLVHGRFVRFLFGAGNVLTFGRYVHRENSTPDLMDKLEVARRVQYHTRLLKQFASSPQVDVDWNMNDVRASLKFLSDQANTVNGSTAKAAARLFEHTSDAEARRLCLELLSRVHDKTARSEMLRMFREQQPQSEWRAELADRLRKAISGDSRIKAADAKNLLSEIGQP